MHLALQVRFRTEINKHKIVIVMVNAEKASPSGERQHDSDH